MADTADPFKTRVSGKSQDRVRISDATDYSTVREAARQAIKHDAETYDPGVTHQSPEQRVTFDPTPMSEKE